MAQHLPDNLSSDQDECTAEMNLTDADILDAMQHIPGYLDISAEDFRLVYHLAYRHALERLFIGVTAGRLMRKSIQPLQPGMMLDQAAKMLAETGYKGLPVVNDQGQVMGMLTETDFLKYLHADTFLELLLKMLEGSFQFKHGCHETPVHATMTQPVITVKENAQFIEILDAFHAHGGRSMPVVDAEGRLLGLLLRKDFLAAYKLAEAR